MHCFFLILYTSIKQLLIHSADPLFHCFHTFIVRPSVFMSVNMHALGLTVWIIDDAFMRYMIKE